MRCEGSCILASYKCTLDLPPPLTSFFLLTVTVTGAGGSPFSAGVAVVFIIFPCLLCHFFRGVVVEGSAVSVTLLPISR